MADELINMDGIGTALMYITDNLGMTVVQMYEIYARAQFIIGMVQIILILLWCIIMFFVIKSVYTWCHKKKSHHCFDADDQENHNIFLTLLITSCIGVVLAFIMWTIYDPVIACLCPEYTALKSLMYDIGKMIV